MSLFERLTKNNLKFGAFLLLYSMMLIALDELLGSTWAPILAVIFLWIFYAIRWKKLIDFLDPMILPGCAICTAISGYALFSFSKSMGNEYGAVISLGAVMACIIFAIYKASATTR